MWLFRSNQLDQIWNINLPWDRKDNSVEQRLFLANKYLSIKNCSYYRTCYLTIDDNDTKVIKQQKAQDETSFY